MLTEVKYRIYQKSVDLLLIPMLLIYHPSWTLYMLGEGVKQSVRPCTPIYERLADSPLHTIAHCIGIKLI